MDIPQSYGKSEVAVYRTYVPPLRECWHVPESSYRGSDNNLFAQEVDVEVFGHNFLVAYTEGDNSNVVATDTMKNFILREALAFQGSTPEQFLWFVGRRFLETYDVMERLRITGRQIVFTPADVPADNAFRDSGALFARQRSDHGLAWLDLDRGPAGPRIVDHQCGRVGLQLIKLTGSSFAKFRRDSYTTLPEVVDRPLYIHLDVHWRYLSSADAAGPSLASYVASEQIRDLATTVFHQFVSMSIQHLVHEIGQRVLQRCPQIGEVSFVAQNRLWDTAEVSPNDPAVKVYCDPRPPYGRITLTLRREA